MRGTAPARSRRCSRARRVHESILLVKFNVYRKVDDSVFEELVGPVDEKQPEPAHC